MPESCVMLDSGPGATCMTFANTLNSFRNFSNLGVFFAFIIHVLSNNYANYDVERLTYVVNVIRHRERDSPS